MATGYNVIEIITLEEIKKYTVKTFELTTLKGEINSYLLKAAKELNNETIMKIDQSLYTPDDIEMILLELQSKGYNTKYDSKTSDLIITWQLTDQELMQNFVNKNKIKK